MYREVENRIVPTILLPEIEDNSSAMFSNQELNFTAEPKSEPYPEPETEIEYKIYPEPEANLETKLSPEAEPRPSEVEQVMTVAAGFAGVMGLLIMIENLIVLLTLVKGKPRQKRSVTYLIGNLAVADFVAGFHLIWFVCIDFFLIKNRPKLYIIIMCSLWLVTIVVSVIGLFNFAIFRLKLAKSKESYKLTRRTAIISIIASWLIPIFVLVIPPIAGWNCADDESPEEQCSQVLYPFTRSFVLLLAILVVAAIIGLVFVYAWILKAVQNKVCKLKKKSSIKQKQKEMIHSIFILLLLFIVCILPIAVCLLIDYASSDFNLQLATAFPILVIISFINSIANPFVYIWRLPSMKSALWRLLGYQGQLPNEGSFKDMVKWKITSQKSRNSRKVTCKRISESSEKLSRKYASHDVTVTASASGIANKDGSPSRSNNF